MRKLIFLGLALIAFQFANAQNDDGTIFKKFKVDVSLGYAIPQESSGSGGAKGGVLFVVEPKYAVMDQISVGLRMEAALMASINMDGETGSVQANASYLATGDYYFSNNKLRPFGGVGAGIFTYAKASEKTLEEDIKASSKFGFMVRGGVEYGHLRFGLEYNIVADKAGYFGIKLGAVIGGGRK